MIICDMLPMHGWFVSTPFPMIPGGFNGRRDSLAFKRFDLFLCNVYSSTSKLFQFLRMGAVNCWEFACDAGFGSKGTEKYSYV